MDLEKTNTMKYAIFILRKTLDNLHEELNGLHSENFSRYPLLEEQTKKTRARIEEVETALNVLDQNL